MSDKIMGALLAQAYREGADEMRLRAMEAIGGLSVTVGDEPFDAGYLRGHEKALEWAAATIQGIDVEKVTPHPGSYIVVVDVARGRMVVKGLAPVTHVARGISKLSEDIGANYVFSDIAAEIGVALAFGHRRDHAPWQRELGIYKNRTDGEDNG